jgi:hypothetical protein
MGPRGEAGIIPPDLFARIARLEEHVAAARLGGAFAAVQGTRPGAPPMTHIADIGASGPEFRAAGAGGRVAETTGRPPVPSETTGATIETGRATIEPGPGRETSRTGVEVRPSAELSRTRVEAAPPAETSRPMAAPSRTAMETSRPEPSRTMERGRAMETGRPGNGSRRTDQRRRSDDDTAWHRTTETRRDNGSSLGWLWALPLVALAGLGLYFLRPTEETTPVATRDVTQQTARDTVAAIPDLKGPVLNAITALTTTFEGITDQTTATPALPKIQETARDMDRLAVQTIQLPSQARTALAEATREQIGKLNTVVDNVTALPGVGPVLAPAMASLRNRMDAIAMAPGKPMFLAYAPGEWTLLSNVYNRDVQNRSGERMGTASNFYLGPDGRLVASILSVDRQLGIGDKQVGMPFASGQFVRRDDGWHFVIDATKDDLQKAKTFETK